MTTAHHHSIHPLDDALALIVQQQLRLATAEHAWEHLAQTVGRHSGQRPADLGGCFARRQGLRQVADQQLAGGAGRLARHAVGVAAQFGG